MARTRVLSRTVFCRGHPVGCEAAVAASQCSRADFIKKAPGGHLSAGPCFRRNLAQRKGGSFITSRRRGLRAWLGRPDASAEGESYECERQEEPGPIGPAALGEIAQSHRLHGGAGSAAPAKVRRSGPTEYAMRADHAPRDNEDDQAQEVRRAGLLRGGS